MQINYEEIIAKANERAEKLKALQEYTQVAEHHATLLLTGLLYFSNLSTRVQALDIEGRDMFGVCPRVESVGAYCAETYRLLTTNNDSGSNQRVLMALVEKLK